MYIYILYIYIYVALCNAKQAMRIYVLLVSTLNVTRNETVRTISNPNIGRLHVYHDSMCMTVCICVYYSFM